jgi:membrane protease YdiL (CAAX protease family)
MVGRAARCRAAQSAAVAKEPTLSAAPAPREAPIRHGVVFLIVVAVLGFSIDLPPWPWYLVLLLGTHGWLVLMIPALRRTVPPLRWGRVDAGAVLVAAGLALATTAALTAYHLAVRPDVNHLVEDMPGALFGSVLLAWVSFSVLNAALEEVIFRDILYQAVAADWGAVAAVLVTAILFGLGHLNGYPPGPAGAFMAGCYGAALGGLRWWTGGLALPIACHVCADATIFGLLLYFP